MIIVKLMGGLGNQLFQYATGRALAVRYNVPLKLDLSFLKADTKGHYTKRDLELEPFKLKYEISTQKELSTFQETTAFQKFKKYIPFLLLKKFVANEKAFAFENDFSKFPANTYLNGFWQSEKYFKSIRPELLKEISLKYEMPEVGKDFASRISETNSVAIHVRRGDYVTNKNASSFHGLLPSEYYNKAISLLNSKYEDLRFFVFSDDLAWVRQHMSLPANTIFIEYTSEHKTAMDLILMSKCAHNIIANSSYSWWGAWLNKNETKTVIAPERWFLDKSLDTGDLLPSSWIKI